MKSFHRVFIGLGTNLGNRKQHLAEAVQQVSMHIGTIIKPSGLYETPAWGLIEQPDFLNQVLEVQTHLSPQEVLSKLLAIEQEMGRIRTQKWGPRLIDLDILFYDDLVLDKPNLKIPHPYIQERAFVLEPLFEIAPDFIHPVFKKTSAELLRKLQLVEQIKVRKVTKEDELSIYQFICLLEKESLDYQQFAKIFNENIQDKNHYYLIAEIENTAIGFISFHTQNLLHHCGRVGEIQEFFVVQNFRNFGVGKMLISKIDEYVKEQKLVSYEVTTNKKRIENIEIYQRLGFTLSHNKFTKKV